MFGTPNITEEQQYDINLQLCNEYKTYIADSAIYYVKQNYTIAENLNIPIFWPERNISYIIQAK